MATVTANGRDFFAYSSVEEASDYLAGSENYAAWMAFSANQMAVSLVEGARLLDRQIWREPYTTREARETVDQVKYANIELAFLIASGETGFLVSETTASNIKRQRASSVEQEFWSPLLMAGGGGYRFPLPVWELLKGFIASSSGDQFGGSVASGTCDPSISTIDYRPAPTGDDNWNRALPG